MLDFGHCCMRLGLLSPCGLRPCPGFLAFSDLIQASDPSWPLSVSELCR